MPQCRMRLRCVWSCVLLVALSCVALSATASRPRHPIFAASPTVHASKHISRLDVLNGFRITHGHADKIPMAGFHPDAPPVPKPIQKLTNSKTTSKKAVSNETQTFDGIDVDLSALTQEERSELESITSSTEVENEQGENDSAEFSDLDLDHWTVHGPPHSYHKGQPQLFPNEITLHFRAFDEDHALELHIMKELFNEHSTVQVFDGDNNLIEERRHVLQSYWAHSRDGTGWATATLHRNGQFQAVVHKDGDTIQIDPVQLHEQEMESEAYQRLHRAAHHHSVGHTNTQKGLVAFKHSDQPNLHKTHSCGSMKTDAGRSGNSSEPEMELEPLQPYTAAARRLLQTTSATSQGYGNFPQPANNAGISPWSGCFTSDTTKPIKFAIGFAVDTGMYNVWGSVSGVQQYIAWQIAVSNLVYLTQMHVFLTVSDVIIQTALGTSAPAWNDAPPSKGAKCPITIQTKLNTLSAWRGASVPTKNGMWSLQTNCYPPAGTVGLAWIGVLCNTYYGASISTFSSNQWLTTAHELGHNFAAQHTFQLGQGSTGGIMDYGDGRLNGIFQFHTTYSQAEMCSAIRGTTYSTGIQPYCTAAYVSACGNGIVEPGEGCDDTSSCCIQPGQANACQLASTSQCSGETPCCTGCKFKPSSTQCMGGSGLCQNGFCAVSSCQSYSGLSFCGTVSTNPCRQQCVSSTKACSDGYTSPNLNLPDGIVCSTSPYSTCLSGQCKSATSVTYSWTTSGWSACSCSGSQTRSAYCSGSDGSLGTEGTQCSTASKPALSQGCTIPSSCTTYSWKQSSWSSCSVDCGSGVQQASVQCISSSTGLAVSELSCTAASKPTTAVSCNTQACPTAFVYSAWSSCSATCGGGTQTRTATCQRTQNGVVTAVADSNCSGKQATSQACNTATCPPPPAVRTYSLTYGTWGTCSVSCGPGGSQTRATSCVSSDGVTYPLSNCGCGSGTSTSICPGSQQSCNTQVCPSYAWTNPAWGTCSLSCGSGIQTRTVQCINQATNTVVANTNCVQAQPAGVQSCNTQTCTTQKWGTGPWQPCSLNCGSGTQTRAVKCIDSNSVVLADSMCDSGSKPASSQSCNQQACPAYQWLLSEWSSCSAVCGGGTQTRTVKCVAVGSLTAVSYTNCDTSNIPTSAQFCNTGVQCPLDSDVQWQLAEWSDCSSICGGNAVRNRTVICTNIHTNLTVDPSLCPVDYRPETSSLCPDVTCPTYWFTTPWSTCTASCNGGLQHRQVECRYQDDLENPIAIDDELCTGTKPAIETDCNLIPCPKWQAEPWSDCSARCGVGQQTRGVSCVTWDNQNTTADQCATSPILSTVQTCSNQPCPHWHDGPWSVCDQPCGGGNQTRTLICHMPHDDIWQGQSVADSSLCPPMAAGDNGNGIGAPSDTPVKPATWRLCNTDSCPANFWEVIKWTECSKACGSGIQTGQAVCKSAPGAEEDNIVADSLCSVAPPASTRDCNIDPCPTYAWLAPFAWSNCSVQCGTGTQTRAVHCANTSPASWKGISWELLEDESPCAALPKLPSIQPCSFPASVCFGTATGLITHANGLCTTAGSCLCRPGFAGDYCDGTPNIHTVLTNGASYTSGIPPGDTLQITWQSEGSLPWVSILISREYASDPNDNWIVPAYVARDIVNTGTYSWNVGDDVPDLEAGDGYVVRIWFSSDIWAQNAISFRVADPCDYKSCGVHGVCGVGGVCQCVKGYSGATCSLGPCERARCSTSYGSCQNEDYIGSPDVTDETLGICLCGKDASGEHYDGFQCRSPPSCTPRCKNGADLVNIIIDLEGKTSEALGQCGTCACMNLWGGQDCGTCELQCYHGGTVNSLCSSCDCSTAPGYFGTTCGCKFYSLEMRLTLSADAHPTSWINDAVTCARFSRTLAIDLALAAGQVSGVNIQVNVVSLRLDPADTANVLADIQFGLECPQLSADVVMSAGSLMDTESAKQLRGIETTAESKQGGAFNLRLSPMTVIEPHSASFFPNKAAKEAAAAVTGSPSTGVDVTDGRASLSSVYEVFAASCEDLTSPLYRGVITSTLTHATVISARDLTGQDSPRVPSTAIDPYAAVVIAPQQGQGGSSASDLSTGALAGIIVGGVALVLILALIAFHLWRVREHKIIAAQSGLTRSDGVEMPASSLATTPAESPQISPRQSPAITPHNTPPGTKRTLGGGNYAAGKYTITASGPESDRV